ncbi:hypothetical protein ACFV3R_11275 [Streptomyces sp. NPDC059740]|uniref:hypothetical protein n=1 Tax=Streptomyces sp. NPDC059740 TaxID=3346926 RepID=UPI003655D371
MSVDVQHPFDTKFPDAFARHPDEAKVLDVVYVVRITGDVGGTWQVNASPAGPQATKGDPAARRR